MLSGPRTTTRRPAGRPDYIDIDTWSVGNPVLVFGDTNSRYTRACDNIATLTTQNALIDA